MGYSPRWYIVQRVGLTEEEDEYLKKLQESLGLRHRHQVLRILINMHREKHDKGGSRGRSPKGAAKGKGKRQ